jgi:site-specific DNA-methyltransferase (adenine-specific)
MPAHYGIICFSKGKPVAIANHEQEPCWKVFSESMSLKQGYCVRNTCIKQRNAVKVIDREPIGNLWWDIHRLKHNSKRVDHPCQLPPALMKRLIHTFTQKGELVLDPFNGAGTTSLVAEMLGRRFIGIELSEKYHSIAEQRHSDLKRGRDPFAKNDETPKSKNSRVARLKKQKYQVPKKTLQLEVREIAFKLGKKPDREDVIKFSQYPIHYFDEYFIDWGEVCGAIGDKGMIEDPLQPLSVVSKVQQTELSFDD